jgi:putative transposase
MDVQSWLRKQLEQASPDLLRAMVRDFAEALMGAEADAICGAPYGERSPERVNIRNGYRERAWDTRVGTVELAIPKLRAGSYFPDWLLQPRRRAEQAFVSVIADAYLAGVSTRRVEKLVQQLGVERMSKSQVSRLAKSLDAIVEDFRTRPLDGAPYPYLVLDALEVKCREGGRTVNACVVHAVAVNRDGFRESLGLDVVTTEDGAAWLAFLRSLVARGLAGVRLVTSDAHPGLVDAIAATLPGASWQRCRTHFMRNLLTRVPKSAQSFVATMVRSIFAQPDAETVHEQHRRIADQLETRFPDAAALLEKAAADLLAFTHFPKEHWRQLWSTDESVKWSLAAPVVESARARVTPDRRVGRGDASLAAQDCRLTASESHPSGGTRARSVGCFRAPVGDELAVGELALLAQSAFSGAHFLEVVGVGGAALAAA